jgi:hypothetical protein
VIGILGAYVGRIYEEVQRRPLYTVAREVNFAQDEKSEKAGEPCSLPPAGLSNAKGEETRGETT